MIVGRATKEATLKYSKLFPTINYNDLSNLMNIHVSRIGFGAFRVVPNITNTATTSDNHHTSTSLPILHHLPTAHSKSSSNPNLDLSNHTYNRAYNQDHAKLIESAVLKGINFIDTASNFKSESVIGDALKSLVNNHGIDRNVSD